MKPKDVLASLGAVGTVVAGYWATVAADIKPPLSDSLAFFGAITTVVGVLAGGVMAFARSKNWVKPWMTVSGAATFGALGVFAFFVYESVYEARVVKYSESDPLIVGNLLSQDGVTVLTNLLVGGGYDACSSDDPQGFNSATREVSFACARALAENKAPLYETLFDAGARSESSNVLARWYRATAASFMVALFLLVDEGIAAAARARRKRRS